MRHITKQTDYCKKMTFVYAQSWIRSRADLTIFLMCWMSPGTKNSCRSDITVLIPEADLPVTRLYVGTHESHGTDIQGIGAEWTYLLRRVPTEVL